MKIIVSGLCGYMGREVAKAALDSYKGAVLVGGIDLNSSAETPVPCAKGIEDAGAMFSKGSADCIIDFSHHSAIEGLLSFALEKNIPIVVATTGHDEREKELIKKASEKIPVFFSANMSLGVALLASLAKRAASAMPDASIEIIEKHHVRKLDAPSGTALMLFDEIKKARKELYAKTGRSGHGKREFSEVGIHAVRMGNIVGEHEIIIGNGVETITLKHEAHDRALFALGAISAADFLYKKEAGLYSMHDLFND